MSKMGQINHTLKIAYFSLRNINRAQGSLLSWTHLPMGTYTVVMRVARRLSHKIYTTHFLQKSHILFFFPLLDCEAHQLMMSMLDEI